MDLAYVSVSPNTLFDALKSRATRSLQQQFFTGTMGRAGDRGYILDRVARQKEKEDLVTDEPADDFYTFFTNGDKYGRSFRISSLSKMGKEVRTEVDAAFRAGLCVPRSVGNLVLKRQISILTSLNALVDGILEAGKGREAAEMIKALDKLVIGQSEAQPSVPWSWTTRPPSRSTSSASPPNPPSSPTASTTATSAAPSSSQTKRAACSPPRRTSTPAGPSSTPCTTPSAPSPSGPTSPARRPPH